MSEGEGSGLRSGLSAQEGSRWPTATAPSRAPSITGTWPQIEGGATSAVENGGRLTEDRVPKIQRVSLGQNAKVRQQVTPFASQNLSSA